MSDIYFRFTSQMYSMYFRLYLTSSSELSKKKKRMYPSEGCIFARAKKPRHFFHTCFLEHIFERARVTFWTPCLICLQAIVESPTGQLKLGEIYTWFSNNFKHFRTTCNLTWKVTKSFFYKKCIPFLLLFLITLSQFFLLIVFHRTFEDFVSF